MLKYTILNAKKILYSNLWLPGQQKLINQWTGLWLINAQKEREQVEVERTIRQNAGLEKGVKEFALSASRDVARQTPTVPAHALELLINASTQEIKSKPGLFKYLHNRLPDLAEILNWLKNKLGPAA